MSLIGRILLTSSSRNHCASLIKQLGTIRFNGTNIQKNSLEENVKSDVSLAESCKIDAAVLKDYSSSLTIEPIEFSKEIQSNEVLIDIHYCAVNASDILLSKNMYDYKPKLPIVLGYELIGRLVQIGQEAQKKGYKVGDKVVALNKDCYGGFAEQCVAETDNIWKVPSTIKCLDAVCLLKNYMTALIALERIVTINEDDTILINVGASGNGLAAVDLATNVFRAKVIGICFSNTGAALVREKGAFVSLKYSDRKLLKHIEEIAMERNIKAVFDDVGGTFFKKTLSCFTDIYKDDTSLKDLLRDDNFTVVVHHLSREGRIVLAGTTVTKTEAQVGTDAGSFNFTGFSLGEYRKKDPKVYRQAGEDILQFVEDGLITPSCSLIVGLYKINDALKFAADLESPGKELQIYRRNGLELTFQSYRNVCLLAIACQMYPVNIEAKQIVKYF